MITIEGEIEVFLREIRVEEEQEEVEMEEGMVLEMIEDIKIIINKGQMIRD